VAPLANAPRDARSVAKLKRAFNEVVAVSRITRRIFPRWAWQLWKASGNLATTQRQRSCVWGNKSDGSNRAAGTPGSAGKVELALIKQADRDGGRE